MARVSFYLPDGGEKTFRLFPDRTLRVGRDPGNDAVLRDAKVSRRHAEVVFEKGFYVIHDLGSSNGTYVNGRRVRVAPLTDGAELRVGGTLGKFSEELSTPQTLPDEPEYDEDEGPTGTVGVRTPVIDFPVKSRPQQPPTAPLMTVSDDDEVFETKPHTKADFFSKEVHERDHGRDDDDLPPPASIMPGKKVKLDETRNLEPRRPTFQFEPIPEQEKDEDEENGPAEFSELEIHEPLTIDTRTAERSMVLDSDDRCLFYFRRPASFPAMLAGIVVAIMLLSGSGAAAFLLIDRDPLSAVMAGLITAVFVAAVLAFIPSRSIVIFEDEAMTSPAMMILQESLSPFPTLKFSARNPDGKAIAYFHKSFFTNFGRRSWRVVDEYGDVVGLATEDSLLLAVLRKLLGSAFNRLTTDFLIQIGGRVAGRLRRRATEFCRSVLSLYDLRRYGFDPRIALALAVIIETVERR